MVKKLQIVLTKYWQTILMVLAIIVAAISVRSCQVKNDNVKVILHKSDSAFSVAKYYTNKNNELVGQVNTHKLTINELKQFGEQLGFDNAALKSEVGNLKNLVAHWEGKVVATQSITTVLHDTTFVDKKSGASVNAKAYRWNNKWMTLKGVVVNDNLTILYLYHPDFSLTAYRQPKHGFWKPAGQLVADIKFSDQNVKVGDFKGFVVEEPRKKWYETNVFKYSAGFLGGVYFVSRIR